MRELSWVANYIDGEKLPQFLDGVEQKYANIDRERLERFDLIDKETGKAVHSVYTREGQRLIYRRRTIKQIGKPDVVIYLVGYQITVMANTGPRNMVILNYLYPDGSVALDGARNNLELLPFE